MKDMVETDAINNMEPIELYDAIDDLFTKNMPDAIKGTEPRLHADMLAYLLRMHYLKLYLKNGMLPEIVAAIDEKRRAEAAEAGADVAPMSPEKLASIISMVIETDAENTMLAIQHGVNDSVKNSLSQVLQ